MKYRSTVLLAGVAVGLSAVLSACVPVGGGSSYPSSYDPYASSRYDRDDYYDERRELEREDRRLDREREQLESERRRLEAERERDRAREREEARRRHTEERCPSGFSPSSGGCSPEERRRGCKDIRLSNGQGCIKR